MYVGDDVCVCGVCVCMLRVWVCMCVYLWEAEKLRLTQVSVEI